MAVAALAAALAGCGDGEGSELAAGNSRLSEAQIDAALGPEDQTMVQDAIPRENANNGMDPIGNNSASSAANSAAADDEGEE
jgi:hypothetical protein